MKKNIVRAVCLLSAAFMVASTFIGGLATAITTSSSLSGVLSKLLLAMALSAFSAEAASGFLKVIDLGVQAHDEVKAKTKAGKENVMYYYYLATKL